MKGSNTSSAQNDSTTNRGGGQPFTNSPAKSESNAIDIPSISLPKGGGAIKGIDEKFEVNAANGTAGFSLPLPLSPGRGGFSPALSVGYNSGAGNSIFGIGWGLQYASIQRKTDKRLPRYRDKEASDTFMFSGLEDLVPVLKENGAGNWQKEAFTAGDYHIKTYRPRIEGAFSRIEQISHPVNGVWWKVTASNNVVTFFGKSPAHRIADPADPKRIFEWLPELSFDDKGNCLIYTFKAEDGLGFPKQVFDKNRFNANGTPRFTNRYLKRVSYCNRIPFYPNYSNPDGLYNTPNPVIQGAFLMEAVFDYGEHGNLPVPVQGEATVHYLEQNVWPGRHDAFSEYRPGFEIRACRLCRRVLMYHHFAELGQTPCLISSLDVEYRDWSLETQPEEGKKMELTYLVAAHQRGYIRKAGAATEYIYKSLPPMEFGYQELAWNREIKSISAENIANAPTGLSGGYQWVDFYNEGIPGILTEQAEGWFYKENLGNGEFSGAKPVIPKPSYSGLSTGLLQLQDLAADGRKQVVVHSPGAHGYFELTDHALPGRQDNWKAFRAFAQVANVDLRDPNIRMLDLNGDGQPDLLVSEEKVFTWYPAKGREGYDAPELAPKPFDDEQGPAIVFADADQSIYLADMSGDGLTDIVRIRNGEVCYWPNLGYGHFGTKVTMAFAPLFDSNEAFRPDYLQLADISGTGATDLIYLGKNGFRAWLNLSGNTWSAPCDIAPFPSTTQPNQITIADLLGSGTSCIVWSSPLPNQSYAPLRYIDLMGGQKPHIMNFHKNNLGKETTLEFRSSTQYYLEDKKAGKPWVTKLPFPVQVVGRVTVEDKITRVRFSSQYRYHHGHYDHAEREFRGFGMVEQTDSEHYENWHKNSAGTRLEPSEELYQKPVLSKTWFHTGGPSPALPKGEGAPGTLQQFEHEYWYNELARQGFAVTASEAKLPDSKIVAAANIADAAFLENLSAEEWLEALRACKGMTLRQEVFALDAPEAGATPEQLKKQLTPFTVATHNCHISVLQPRAGNSFAVFMPTESEAISYQYERTPEDLRIAHSLNLRFNELGQVLESAAVVYPRMQEDLTLPPNIRAEQQKTLITCTRNTFTNDVVTAQVYLLRQGAETETFELTKVPKTTPLYQLSDFTNLLTTGSSAIEYQVEASGNAPQRRPIERARNLFYNNDLSGPLPFGQLGVTGIPFEAYQLAYTPALLTHLFGDKIPDQNAAMTEGKFVHVAGDANWWIRSGTTQFKTAGENIAAVRNRFFAPFSYTDPFGSVTKVRFYGNYFLMIQETEDAIGNRAKVERFDFRTLAPTLLRDLNDNLSSVLTDELGMVKAVAALGKDLNLDGVAELEIMDNLSGLEEPTLNETVQIAAFFGTADSVAIEQAARPLLRNASARFVYDLEQYRKTGKPTVTATITRETHQSQENGTPSRLQFAFEYSDGMGNVAMAKVPAEPGTAKQLQVQPDGSFTLSEVDTAAQTPRRLRWLGNGRTILNNKGKPVKQYEPFFSVTPFYEDAAELVETGVTPIIYYDAPGRVVRTEMPDGTFSKVEFDSWKQTSFDPNDTVMDSAWYHNRINRLIDNQLLAAGKDPVKEKTAAQKAALHYNTPSTVHVDTLGRPFFTVDHNKTESGADEFLHTTIVLDIEGNPRRLIDARNNAVMAFRYDMLGQQVYENSMDKGERWALTNALGLPVRSWDQRNHVFSSTYDTLHRPVTMRVQGGDGPAPLNHVFERITYGEGQPDDKRRNLRGTAVLLFDTAGKTAIETIDAKGNVLSSNRRLCKDYKNTPNWNTPLPDPLLENEVFTTTMVYDALNRITEHQTPDGSITRPGYNEANLLKTIVVTQNGATQPFVKNINYDEKGRRTSIVYGNELRTKYQYDPETFRLLHLHTSPPPFGGQGGLQDLYYTYDPVGNITEIEDKAIPTVFFNGQKMEAKSEYRYDALYRLVEASGREHAGQNPHGPEDNWDDKPFLKQYQPGDAMAWRNYTQQYQYDGVGNILQMKHIANGGSWTRNNTYETQNNRLKTTGVGNTPPPGGQGGLSHHAQHGFIISLPHLQVMQWNFKEELQATARQRVTNGGTSETTYYVYDSGGQRTRKVTEMQAAPGATATRKCERIYLGSVEVYREFTGPNAGLERGTLHVSDDTGRIAMIETRNTVNDGSPQRLVRYQFGNHLGSACLETDDTGRVISYEEYHPYGTTSYQAVDASIKAAAKRYRYTGMERDEETGLAYHTARYYLPWLGRWLSGDPIGVEGGWNLWGYCDGRPIIGSDIKGTDFTIAPEIVATGTETPAEVRRITYEAGFEYPLGIEPILRQDGDRLYYDFTGIEIASLPLFGEGSHRYLFSDDPQLDSIPTGNYPTIEVTDIFAWDNGNSENSSNQSNAELFDTTMDAVEPVLESKFSDMPEPIPTSKALENIQLKPFDGDIPELNHHPTKLIPGMSMKFGGFLNILIASKNENALVRDAGMAGGMFEALFGSVYLGGALLKHEFSMALGKAGARWFGGFTTTLLAADAFYRDYIKGDYENAVGNASGLLTGLSLLADSPQGAVAYATFSITYYLGRKARLYERVTSDNYTWDPREAQWWQDLKEWF